MNTKSKIKSKCKALEDLLLSKNEKYGNSALEPLNVFSKAGAVAGIKVRIDDKLKRIMNAGLVDETEDTLQDLAGYLILLMIAKDNESNAIQKRIREKGSTPRNSEDSPQTHTGGEFEVQYI
tara:strand:+ start:1058 stop:1423 length:366 start_codon:yes stop_codon:yes gene_type:complete